MRRPPFATIIAVLLCVLGASAQAQQKRVVGFIGSTSAEGFAPFCCLQ